MLDVLRWSDPALRWTALLPVVGWLAGGGGDASPAWRGATLVILFHLEAVVERGSTLPAGSGVAFDAMLFLVLGHSSGAAPGTNGAGGGGSCQGGGGSA